MWEAARLGRARPDAPVLGVIAGIVEKFYDGWRRMQAKPSRE